MKPKTEQQSGNYVHVEPICPQFGMETVLCKMAFGKVDPVFCKSCINYTNKEPVIYCINDFILTERQKRFVKWAGNNYEICKRKDGQWEHWANGEYDFTIGTTQDLYEYYIQHYEKQD